MRRHHRQSHRYSGCSAQALTPEENGVLLDRFLESLNNKIDAEELARRDLPHGVLAASADGGIPSVYGPFTDSIEVAAFARQLEQKLGAISNNVHFQVIPIDSPE